MLSLHQAPLAVLVSTCLTLPGVAFAAPLHASLGASTAQAPPAEMSDAEKMEVAKGLYGEGVSALEGGDAATALAKFESAYHEYAPTLHVFNYNIGQAAYELGDCAKAKQAFQRFLDLVSEHPMRGDATERILEIERSGCAAAAPAVAPTPEAPPVTTGPSAADNVDAPELTSRRDEREEKIDEEVAVNESKKAGPLLVSGAVAAGIGGLALVGGAVSLALANKKANELADLASPGPTGFPNGNYSDDKVFNLDRNSLPANNGATIALFSVGGVATAVGVALLVVHFKRKKGKKAGDKNAWRSSTRMAKADVPASRPRLMGIGAAPMPGGGASASASVRF